MSEDFLSRWSRLKRESGAEPAHRSETQTTDSASPPRDPAPAPAIDVSSLPEVESINAESNVAAFLGAGVPEDLTRAALRNAWASDPAIRDFVGIAENQWDFNGEGTIPGFGPLSAEEYAQHLAARAVRVVGATATPEEKNAAERESSGAVGRHDSTDRAPVASAPASAAPSHPLAQAPVGESESKPETPPRAPESTRAPWLKHTHGSALPK